MMMNNTDKTNNGSKDHQLDNEDNITPEPINCHHKLCS